MSARAAAQPLPRPAPRWRLIAELLALAALLGVALALRVFDLEGPRSSFPDLFDEGIRAEQLLLMERGFRPFRDIYTAQGLLLLDLLYPFYVLFGGTLGAIRLGVGLLSVVGLAGVWWSVRQVTGPIGGLAALLLLSASGAYLEGSRLALAEVPSLAPCLWALGCAVRWRRGGRAGWLYAAAALATLGVLIKPMVLPVAVPLGLLALLRPGLRWRELVIALGVVLAVVALAVVAMGPAEVWRQIVEYRLGAREGGSLDFRRNYKLVVQEPFRDQPGLYILAALGALLLLLADWRSGLALAAWPLATIALLLYYYPLHPKHLVYLYPPLAVVGGAGIGRAAWYAWREGPAGRLTRLLTVAVAVFIAALPLQTLSGPLDAGDPDAEAEDADLHTFDADVVRSLQALSGPDDFILTDHPYLAALARRMVPPDLVDPSVGRIRAGVLRDSDVLADARRYDVRLVLTWADRLRRLAGVPPWLDREYVLAHVFGLRSVKNPRGAKDRSLYLRTDSDLDAARTRLENLLTVRDTADFGGQLRLLGSHISATVVRPRDQFTLTLGWLALQRMPVDYHLTIHLIGPDGQTRGEQEHDLEGSARGTSLWAPGRWLFRTFGLQLDPDSPAGEYRVEISVIDPKSGRALPPVIAPGAHAFRENRSRALTVATIQVR